MTILERSGASADAIRFHYDLSNPFYELWLDPLMTYTCAMFADDEHDDALESAQLRKIDYFASLAGISEGAHVLDIGCGWGGAAARFASTHGAARVVGLTLSKAQYEYALAHRCANVEVRLEDWQDHTPSAAYDAIVSIEAVEAFASPGMTTWKKVEVYRRFIERCHTWLKPGGKLALQAIAYGNSQPTDLSPFISSLIFPESDLPRLSELAQAIERRFELLTLQNDRRHYVRTLRAWLKRLRANRFQAVMRVGETTVRRYEHYLGLCLYIFASGSCDLFRLAMKRIDNPRTAQRGSRESEERNEPAAQQRGRQP